MAAQCTSNYSNQFAKDVLQGIGAPVSAANLEFMAAWNQWESGTAAVQAKGTACYNPFNTEQQAAGSTPFTYAPNIPSYPDYQTGVTATIQTLTNGRYPNLLAMLKKGTSATATASVPDLKTWGSGNGPLSILDGGGPAPVSGDLTAADAIQEGASDSASTDQVACYWRLKTPGIGFIGGDSICMDPVLWIALGFVSVGAFLLGGALVAIGSGHGHPAAHKIVKAAGVASLV